MLRALFLQMITPFGLVFFICSTSIALATDREFGHPLFRAFTAHDYGEVGQIFAVTEDPEGRMLFGCQDAILAFDNNRWETIPAPGTGYIRSLAVDSREVVWFSSSTQIGYLSRVDANPKSPISIFADAFKAGVRQTAVDRETFNQVALLVEQINASILYKDGKILAQYPFGDVLKLA
jgi:hypothetical protein